MPRLNKSRSTCGDGSAARQVGQGDAEQHQGDTDDARRAEGIAEEKGRDRDGHRKLGGGEDGAETAAGFGAEVNQQENGNNLPEHAERNDPDRGQAEGGDRRHQRPAGDEREGQHDGARDEAANKGTQGGRAIVAEAGGEHEEAREAERGNHGERCAAEVGGVGRAEEIGGDDGAADYERGRNEFAWTGGLRVRA